MIPMNKRIKMQVFIRTLIILTAIITVSYSCKTRRDVLFDKLTNHPIRTIHFWDKKWENKSLVGRIKPAPQGVIDYLHIDNEAQGYSERPVSTEPVHELIEAMKEIELCMPDPVKNLLKEKLIGIFTVNDLGGSGYAEAIRDTQGKQTYGFVVFDVNVLSKRKANEWATWKENSYFKPKENSNVKACAVIESKENNTVANAFRFILLHELGHILGLVSNAHPTWIPGPEPKTADHPFTMLSWKLTERNKIISKFEEKFPERKSLRPYSFEKALLTNDEIFNTYYHLIKNTNYASLHAAANMWEDFAESFATYFHVVIDRRPWQVRIEQKDGPDIIIGSCWQEDRCTRKKEFMKRWFEDPLAVDIR